MLALLLLLGRKGTAEREKELRTCIVWSKAAWRTQSSDFTFVNYSADDSWSCHKAEAVLPKPRSLCASVEHAPSSCPLLASVTLPTPPLPETVLRASPSPTSMSALLTPAVTPAQKMKALLCGNLPGVRSLLAVLCLILQSPTCLVREHPQACQGESACAEEELSPPGCPEGRGLS